MIKKLTMGTLFELTQVAQEHHLPRTGVVEESLQHM